MDDPRVLRIITVGLVLAALAVGYFLLTGGFKAKKAQTEITQVEQVNTVAESPVPSDVVGESIQSASSPAPVQSAYDTLANRSQSNVQTLPKTSFPTGVVVIFSAGALVSGWSLRKYPY